MRRLVRVLYNSYVHPLDRSLSEKFMNSSLIKSCLQVIFTNNLDDVNSYLYSSSCMELGEGTPAYRYMLEGCRMFELDMKPYIYVVRSYFYNVTCIGMNRPIICVPHLLLQQNDAEILRGRIMAAVAAIKAGHHRLSFISWIYDNFASLLPIPLIDTGLRVTKNEWYRAQFYTLDRAFYLATKDHALTLKNILYGETSFELLQNISFGENDTYARQTEEFKRLDTAAEFISFISSYLQAESWLPERYSQVKEYMKSNGMKSSR